MRYIVASLLLFIALNAFGGGYYAMSGAKGVPAEWLRSSPFNNYFGPGLFLFVCIGGACLAASVAVWKRHPLARPSAFFCSILLLLWISIQIAIIGYVSWMQAAIAGAALLILFLTCLMASND